MIAFPKFSRLIILSLLLLFSYTMPAAAFSPPEEPEYGPAMLARIYSGGITLVPNGTKSGVHVSNPDIELATGDVIHTSTADRVDIRLSRGVLLRPAGVTTLNLTGHQGIILQKGLLYIHARLESGNFKVILRDMLIHCSDAEFVVHLDTDQTRDQRIEVWNGEVTATHAPTGERIVLVTGMQAGTSGYPPGGVLHLDEFSPLEARRTWTADWPVAWDRSLPGRDRSLRLLERNRALQDAQAIDKLEGRSNTQSELTLSPPDRWTAKQRAARSRILRHLKETRSEPIQNPQNLSPIRPRKPAASNFVERPSGEKRRVEIRERLY